MEVKYFFSVFNKNGIPTTIDLTEFAEFASDTNYWTPAEVADFYDSLDNFTTMATEQFEVIEEITETRTIPSGPAAGSSVVLRGHRATIKSPYTTIESTLEAASSEFNISNPNSWMSKVLAHPDLVYTPGNYGFEDV